MYVQEFFNQLWLKYTQLTPQALFIHKLFTECGEQVVNDHIAFRTFDGCAFDLTAFTRILNSLGYEAFADYRFPEKHLEAKAFKHNSDTLPKIFASELKRSELSLANQHILKRLIKTASMTELKVSDLYAGRLWSPIAYAEYQSLAEESEYAAWLSTMGLTANHFTVSVNHLQNYNHLEKLNQLLISQGIPLNEVGGLIKGGPDVYLAQSATLADQYEERFACGTTALIPSCFYEFAYRYSLPSGKLFEGFVTNNASKIFDSTHRVID